MQLSTMIISGSKFVLLYFVAVLITQAVVTGLVATVGVKYLDQATRHQCRTHDWPADKAAATSKWCVANGYKI